MNKDKFEINTKNNNQTSLNQNEVQVNLNISNPIENKKILSLNSITSSANKLYGGWANNINKKQEINFFQLIKTLNDCFKNQNDSIKLFYEIHNNFSDILNLNYSAIALYKENSNYLDIKLITKNDASYNTKIMLNDEENNIIKAFLNKTCYVSQNSNSLKLSQLSDIIHSPMIAIPLISMDECFGVFIFSPYSNNALYQEFYKLIANTFACSYKNNQLINLVNKNTDIDSLTGLYNHKKIQEELALEITNSLTNEKDFAFCIIDIANITDINNELGHAKGDTVIKEVAKKIKKTTRNTDILGRWGGDKIAIIMPDTNIDNAKYVCEYLLYNLACTMFDDLGQLKFSCGISMFPNSANKQDKLTMLAQQSLMIAKSKRSKTGQSEIISTMDYNFWDDEALKCFVQILTKKHASIGVDIEEELIKQFHSETIVSNEHMLDVVSSLANTIDAKDTYTKGHSSAVSRYSEALARALNLPSNEVERIKLGALLHDIGKIGVPEHVLRKPTKLNDEEWAIMKQHPKIGADKVLKPNKSLHDLIPMVKYHHEHIDGSGYPYGLKGDEIPLSARIVAVADAYHALISDRPYRKGMSVSQACEILKQGAGKNWDRELVRQFLTIAPSLATNI